MMADLSGVAGGAVAGAKFGPYGAVLGGVLGGMMGGGGEDAAQKAAAEDLAFQKQMYQQQDPFSAGGNRAQYVPKLNTLAMGGPSSVVNDPTYQAMNQASLTDVQRQKAATGKLGSGEEMKSLQQTSQGNMMSYWQNMMHTYSGLSGADSGRTAPMHGMDPGLAGEMAGRTSSNMGGAYGMFASGLSSIFGNPGNTGADSGGLTGLASGLDDGDF